MNSNDLYNAYLDEVATSPATADILWSSAMDLQFSLVSSGHAQAYSSPEASNLPPWAVWKNTVFATTYEPIVIVYNKRLLAADEIPQSLRPDPLTHREARSVCGKGRYVQCR